MASKWSSSPKSSKWVVKGDEKPQAAQEAEPQAVVEQAAPVKPKQKAKAKPRAGKPKPLEEVEAPKVEESTGPTEEQIAASPMLQAAAQATGPTYALMQLLRIKQAETSAGTEADGMGPQTEINCAMPAASRWRTQTREAADEDPTRLSGGRKSVRQDQKAAKQEKRRSSANEEDMPPTPSKISLVTEIHGAEATAAADGALGYGHQLQQDPYMASYLQSMWSGAPLYQSAGYGSNPSTTIMLRNIPNRYTREMLIGRLNQSYQSEFDFVYLPIDFNSKCNIGYAFINFRSPQGAQRCFNDFNGQKTKVMLPGFGSSKVCEVSYARVQGRDANMENLRDDKFLEKLTEQPEWQPIFYDEAGIEIPFSKTLGALSGQRKRSRTNSGGLTPGAKAGVPASPMGAPPMAMAPNFMMPPYPGTPMGHAAMSPPPFFPGAMAQQYAPLARPATLMPHEQKLAELLPDADTKTMQMLRSVPLTVTRSQLVEVLDKSFKGTYNFVFLPAKDDKEGPASEDSRGYAFVNFKSGAKAAQFAAGLGGKTPLEVFGVGADDAKPCEVADGRLASIDKAVDRLRADVAKKVGKDLSLWYPLLFDDGVQKDYPIQAVGKDGAKAEDKSDELKVRQKEAKAKSKQKKAEEKQAQQQAAAYPQQQMPPNPYGYPAYPGFPGFPGGYPGYPGVGGAMPRVHPAYAHSMAQLAHFHARQAATAHAGAHQHQQQAGLLDHLAAAVNPSAPAKPLSAEQKNDLRKQIEYYFSEENLCKDVYLRQHMNVEGWTPVALFQNFPLVKKFHASEADLSGCMKDSEILEIDVLKTFMRLKDVALRDKWAATMPPEYRQTYKGKKDKKAQPKDTAKEPTPAPDAPAAAPDKADSTS